MTNSCFLLITAWQKKVIVEQRLVAIATTSSSHSRGRSYTKKIEFHVHLQKLISLGHKKI